MASKKIIEKNIAIENRIIKAAVPLISEGNYASLSIREICQKIGITTGQFYRHYKSKNDLLAFVYIHNVQEILDSIEPKLEGRTIAEQLVILHTEVAKAMLFIGPDVICIFTDVSNDECDCMIPRDMVTEKTIQLIETAGIVLPEGRAVEEIAQDLVVLSKGIIFEWNTKRGDYDPVRETERIMRMLVPTLLGISHK